MQKIKLWSVESSGSTRKATAVADIDATETEQQLEDLLVNSADLLMDNPTTRGFTGQFGRPPDGQSHPRWAAPPDARRPTGAPYVISPPVGAAPSVRTDILVCIYTWARPVRTLHAWPCSERPVRVRRVGRGMTWSGA